MVQQTQVKKSKLPLIIAILVPTIVAITIIIIFLGPTLTQNAVRGNTLTFSKSDVYFNPFWKNTTTDCTIYLEFKELGDTYAEKGAISYTLNFLDSDKIVNYKCSLQINNETPFVINLTSNIEIDANAYIGTANVFNDHLIHLCCKSALQANTESDPYEACITKKLPKLC